LSISGWMLMGWGALAALVVIAAATIIVICSAARRRRTKRLKQRSGPEYERAVHQSSDRTAAEEAPHGSLNPTVLNQHSSLDPSRPRATP
jgi:hypothetical protein